VKYAYNLTNIYLIKNDMYLIELSFAVHFNE